MAEMNDLKNKKLYSRDTEHEKQRLLIQLWNRILSSTFLEQFSPSALANAFSINPHNQYRCLLTISYHHKPYKPERFLSRVLNILPFLSRVHLKYAWCNTTPSVQLSKRWQSQHPLICYPNLFFNIICLIIFQSGHTIFHSLTINVSNPRESENQTTRHERETNLTSIINGEKFGWKSGEYKTPLFIFLSISVSHIRRQSEYAATHEHHSLW